MRSLFSGRIETPLETPTPIARTAIGVRRCSTALQRSAFRVSGRSALFRAQIFGWKNFAPIPHAMSTAQTSLVFWPRRFFNVAAASLMRSRRKEVRVYIHGFNTDFRSGLERAAQLAVDLEIDGARSLQLALPWRPAGLRRRWEHPYPAHHRGPFTVPAGCGSERRGRARAGRCPFHGQPSPAGGA